MRDKSSLRDVPRIVLGAMNHPHREDFVISALTLTALTRRRRFYCALKTMDLIRQRLGKSGSNLE